MRGIYCKEYGDADVMTYDENIPKPSPTKNQVLINVKAAGVNPVETYIRTGKFAVKPPLPYVPGMDGAGVVTELGADVKNFKVGDRVFFSAINELGSSAEYCVCDVNRVGNLADSATFEDGAMIGVPYFTAYKSLWQLAHVTKADNILIQGATGGVGTAAVQYLKSRDISFIATSGTPEGNEMLTRLGATKIYNHRTPGYMDDIATNEKPVTVIIENFANKNLENDLKLIAFGGRIIIVGTRGTSTIDANHFIGKEVMAKGCLSLASSPEQYSEQVKAAESGLSEGWLRPPLWKKYDIKNASEAHKDIIVNSGSKGQMVLNF